MTRLAGPRLLAAVALMGLGMGGCGGAAETTGAPSATVSVEPATATPATATTAPATATPLASVPSTVPAETPAPTLPEAVILGPDGNVLGTLGSYTMDGHGADAPWLPFDTLPPIEAAANQRLAVAFADGAGIGGWTAGIAPASDTAGTTPVGVGGRDAGAATDSILIDPLPSGRWVLAVRLMRADERGDGVSYWAITVP